MNLKGIAAKRAAAAMLSVILISSSAYMPYKTLGLESGIVYAVESRKYEINNNEYMTRLKWDEFKNKPVFEISFKEMNDKDEKIFVNSMGENILNKGKIQINNGKELSFKESGLEFSNDRTKSCFKSEKLDFIKDFYNSDDISVKITTPENEIIEGKIPNKINKSEQNEVKKIIDKENDNTVSEEGNMEGLSDTKENEFEDSKSNPIIIDKEDTYLKNSYGDSVFRISYQGEKQNEKNNAIIKDENDYLSKAKIKINNKDYGFMEELGFEGKNWPGANVFELRNLENIKDVINSESIEVEITSEKHSKIEFNIDNQLTQEEKTKILGDSEKIPSIPVEDKSKFYSANVNLMHSANGDNSYPYSTTSMAGPVLNNKAEIVETENGKKLIMHFEVKKIMGATAYATGLKLTTEKFGVLKEGDDGDIKSEFILAGDNSGVCIIDLPEIDQNIYEKIYEGHIYSNIMDNTVALRISDIKENGLVSDNLKTLINKTEKDIEGKEFYKKGKEQFDKVFKEAKKDNSFGNSYINLVKAIAGLREKLDNPFEGGDLFFIPVEATSTFASPTEANKKLLAPWGRVVKTEKGYKLELNYGTYSDFSGKAALKDIKILNKDSGYINVDIEKNPDDEAKVSFIMPYFPESGVFKTVLTDLNGREWESDLILDYSNIHKGMNPKLLEEAIHEVDYYQTDWMGPYDGRISNDKRDFYTEKSFNKYLEILNKCIEDLKPENRVNLTQDTIDSDIKLLKEAKDNLLYKEMSGNGNFVNVGTLALNNPKNIYENDTPQIIEAPWAGSKVKFGGKLYKVLDLGNKKDLSDINENTGNIMIMADNYTVNRAWTNSEPEEDTIIRWNDSDLRKYLNDEFYNTFNELEKSVIKESDIETKDAQGSFNTMYSDRLAQGIQTKDKIFILNVDDLQSPLYGLINPGSRKNSNYYFARNLVKPGDFDFDNKYKLCGVKPKGNIEPFNQKFSLPTESYPVMNIDKSKIMMILEYQKDLPDKLKAVEATERNIWELVLKNEGIKLNVSDINIKGNSVDLSYSGTNISGKALVATVITGKNFETGIIKSIGKVSSKLDKSGKVKFRVPDFNKDEDKLYIMAMDMNDRTLSSSKEVEIDASDITVDKTELNEWLTKAQNIDLNNYTDNTSKELNNKIKYALEILKSERTTQGDIEKAVEDLQVAIKNLEPLNKNGEIKYTAPVRMIRHNESEFSMANNAIDHSAKIVEKNGKTNIVMVFKPMKVKGLEGHLIKMSVGDKPVKVLSKDEKGNIKEVSFEVDGKPEKIVATVEVDVMNILAGTEENPKSAPQKVDIVIDWNKKNNIEINEDFSKDAGKITDLKATYGNVNFTINDNNTEKILITIPKRVSYNRFNLNRSFRSAYHNDEMISVTFEKKNSKWFVSDRDENKVKDVNITQLSNGLLKFNVKLSDEIKNEIDKDNNIIQLLSFGKDGNVIFQSYSKIKDNDKKDENLNTDDLNNVKKAYKVPVKAMKRYEDSESMGNAALRSTATVEEKDGKYVYKLYFKPLKYKGLEGRIIDLDLDDYSVNDKNIKGIYDKLYVFTATEKVKEITGKVEVDAMNEINGGKSSPQKVRFVFDWKRATETEKTEDEEADSRTIARKDLKKLIDNASLKKKSDYTDESFEKMEKELKKAKRVYEDLSSSEKELKSAKEDLNSALNKMEEKPLKEKSQEGKLEVPAKILNASDHNKESMANKALNQKVYVKEDKEKKEAIYTIYFKPITVRGLNGHINKLFVYEDGRKIEAKKIDGTGIYKQGFEFRRTTFREKEIRIAVEVDIMKELGAGIQDAILSLDWDNVKEIKKEDKKKSKSYIKGYPDGTFRPMNRLTRAEAAEIIAKFIPDSENGNIKFKDVRSDKWYYNSVIKLSSAGIINGYENNTFRPDDNITRAEIATLIARIKRVSSNSNSFEDVKGHWAENSISALKEIGIINGYENNTFRPDDNITRAEIVAIVNRAFNLKADDTAKKEIDNNVMQFNDVRPEHWYYKDIMIAK